MNNTYYYSHFKTLLDDEDFFPTSSFDDGDYYSLASFGPTWVDSGGFGLIARQRMEQMNKNDVKLFGIIDLSTYLTVGVRYMRAGVFVCYFVYGVAQENVFNIWRREVRRVGG